MKPAISFVIPARNEEGSLSTLHSEILDVMKKRGNFEIIFIDDGSTDNTLKELETLHKKDRRVKVFSLRGGFGKSVALQVGFDNAKADRIFTMDADLQDNPIDIPLFLEKINDGYDLVSGWKWKRFDPQFGKVVPSRIINFLARRFTGLKIHDTNCGFKLYKRQVVQNLNLYGELYRFIPIMAIKQNFKVGEVKVNHRSRQFGKTKFGWTRGIKGILDLLTVIFLTGYVQRPGHFFGSLGLLAFFFGFLIGLYITYLRITTGSIQFRHPLLFLGMLLMIVGVQLISTGLLAEMSVYSRQKFDYTSTIRKVLS